jgi:hypothetical protein
MLNYIFDKICARFMRKNQLKYVHHGYENDSCDKSVVINHVTSLSGFMSHLQTAEMIVTL